MEAVPGFEEFRVWWVKPAWNPESGTAESSTVEQN
jgi:hypothetical protein